MRFWGEAFDVTVNVPDWVALERHISSRLRVGEGFSLATINLDHLVKLRQDQRFRDAYAAQDLVVADGNPIVWMSKLAGRPVSLIPGSDAILPLVRIAAAHRKTLALVGSTDETLAAAKAYLEREVPGTQIVVPSRSVWVDGERRVRSYTRCCSRDVRRVWHGDRIYRSARRA